MTEDDKRRARALHRALWKWRAKHPNREKSEWPGWKKEDYLHDYALSNNECFACALALDAYYDAGESIRQCDGCPIRTRAGECDLDTSLYWRIVCCVDPIKKKQLCLEMAEAWPPVENN